MKFALFTYIFFLEYGVKYKTYRIYSLISPLSPPSMVSQCIDGGIFLRKLKKFRKYLDRKCLKVYIIANK